MNACAFRAPFPGPYRGPHDTVSPPIAPHGPDRRHPRGIDAAGDADPRADGRRDRRLGHRHRRRRAARGYHRGDRRAAPGRPAAGHRPGRPLCLRHASGRRVRGAVHPPRLRDSGDPGHRRGGRRRLARRRARDRAAARSGVGHRGRADDLRDQRRRRADAGAAGGAHQRRRGRRQPARGVGAGGRHLRVRRLVELGRRPRLPDQHQRGADRDHHRRVPQRHLRLLERSQGEPLRRPREPGRGRGVAGNRGRRLAVGRGPRRHLQLPHRRARDRAHLHRVGHPRGERRRAVLHAGRHRLALRPRDLRVAVGGTADRDRLGARRGPERARAPRRQARVVARTARADVLLLLRPDPRGRLPAHLLGRRLRGRPPLGPPDRRLARGPLSQPVLPARLDHLSQEHVRVPEGRLGVQRRHHPERRRLLSPQPGPRRLAAAVHRRRDRRRRRSPSRS